jgi:hypothetical protein
MFYLLLLGEVSIGNSSNIGCRLLVQLFSWESAGFVDKNEQVWPGVKVP